MLIHLFFDMSFSIKTYVYLYIYYNFSEESISFSLSLYKVFKYEKFYLHLEFYVYDLKALNQRRLSSSI